MCLLPDPTPSHPIRAPQVLTVPVRLDGPEPAIARRFALRQMEVMEQKGISKSEAAALVQQEMDAEAAKL